MASLAFPALTPQEMIACLGATSGALIRALVRLDQLGHAEEMDQILAATLEEIDKRVMATGALANSGNVMRNDAKAYITAVIYTAKRALDENRGAGKRPYPPAA